MDVPSVPQLEGRSDDADHRGDRRERGGHGRGRGCEAGGSRRRVVVFTELQDVAYSPCGIPYVHGKEIDSFDRLILLGKEHYEAQGFEIHYETVVSAINLADRDSLGV